MTLEELKQEGEKSLAGERELLKKITIYKINNDIENANKSLEEYLKQYAKTNSYVFTFFENNYKLPIICFENFEHLIEECQDFNAALSDLNKPSMFTYPINYLSFAHNYNTDKDYLDLMFNYAKNNKIDNIEQFVENIYAFTPEIIPYRNYFANGELDLSLDNRKLSSQDKQFLFELIKLQLIHAFYKSNMNLLIGIHNKENVEILGDSCMLSLTLLVTNLINQCNAYKLDHVIPYWYEYLKIMLEEMVSVERQNSEKNAYLGDYVSIYDRYENIFDEAANIIEKYNKKSFTKRRTSKE